MSALRTGALAALAVCVAACAANGPSRAATTEPASTATTARPPRATTTVAPATVAPTTAAPTTTAAPATTLAPAAAADARLAACVAGLPLDRRAALLVWPGIYANQWPTALDVVANVRVGGVVLMTAGAGVQADLRALRATAPHALLVSTDEEGGAVQRLRAFGALPSEERTAATSTPAQARAAIAAHAAVIRDLGIDVVLGPVVDVNPVGGRSPLGDRLFSDDPATVSAFGRAYAQGWLDAGILPVLKHFPGHGSASTDTHKALAVTPPLAQLRARDLQPYVALRDLGPAVMVGHLSVPGLTTGATPTSLSRAAITDLLRGELGYADALVLTDSLEMGGVAATASLTEAAVRSIAAGADAVLFTATARAGAVVEAITLAVRDGRLDEATVNASALRIARRYARPTGLCDGV